MKAGAVVLGVVALVVVGGGIALAAGSSSKPGTFEVTGRSGSQYRVVFVKQFPTDNGGKISFWDVFVGDARILRYSQIDNDTGSRVLIVSPLEQNDPRILIALQDFGVRFEGGPAVAHLVADPGGKLPKGQIVVSPGAWAATVDVGFPKSIVVSVALIRDSLKAQGWQQVNVMKTAPKDWPLSREGNYFVEAVWTAAPRIFALPAEVKDVRSRALA
jgi:hypothetical protein